MHTKYSITTEPLHTNKKAKGKKKTKRINEQLEKKMYNKRQKQFHTKQNRQQLFNSFLTTFFCWFFFPSTQKQNYKGIHFFSFFFPSLTSYLKNQFFHHRYRHHYQHHLDLRHCRFHCLN